MSVATFGLYHVYWFYKQWKVVRDLGEDVTPTARAIFAVFYCHSLFTKMIESARKSGVSAPSGAGGYAAAFIIPSLSWRLPEPFFLIGFLSVVPLLLMQKVANAATLTASPSNSRNTRLSLLNWVGVALGGICWVLVGVGLIVPDPLATPAGTSQQSLSMLAAEFNKTLPKSVDAETQLIETVGLDGVLVYSYRLVNYSASDIDRQTFVEKMRAGLTKAACSTAATRDGLLKQGVTLRHVYRDKNGLVVASVDVSLKDCGF